MTDFADDLEELQREFSNAGLAELRSLLATYVAPPEPSFGVRSAGGATTPPTAAEIMARYGGAGSIPGSMLIDESVSGDSIASDEILARHIIADAIEAGHISAGAVTARSLYIGNFDNLAEDPGFERAAEADTTWNLGAGWAIGTTNPRSGIRAAAFTGGTGALRNRLHADCVPGDIFFIAGWLRGVSSADGTAIARISWLDVNEAEISTSAGSTAASTGAYVESSGYVTAPAGAYFARAEFAVTGRTTGTWYADDLYMRKSVNRVRNDDATVIINEDGITIIDGKLIFIDDITIRTESDDFRATDPHYLGPLDVTLQVSGYALKNEAS